MTKLQVFDSEKEKKGNAIIDESVEFDKQN